jgi:hypothetical protein
VDLRAHTAANACSPHSVLCYKSCQAEQNLLLTEHAHLSAVVIGDEDTNIF